MINRSFLVVVLPVVFAVTFLACKEKAKPEAAPVETANVNELNAGPVVQENLSEAQMEKIMRIQRIFAEVNPSTLEENVDDFKNDRNPDNEIGIWLAMANAYEKFTVNHNPLDRNKKEEAYKLILMRSMENEANAKAETNLHFLTDKDVAEIFSYYTLEARPITVEKR